MGKAHLDQPKPDVGYFSTSEVRSKEETSSSTSRIIALPKNHYQAPPNLAAGFCSLDVSCEGPIRANVVANEITTSSFKIAVETWGKCQLFEASTVWIEHKSNAKDCVFGQFDTQTAATSSPKKAATAPKSSITKKAASLPSDPRPRKHGRPCFFAQPFSEPPEIVCWLNRIDLSSGIDYDYKLRAFADEVTNESFMAHLNSGDGNLNGAAMCWIAFPKRKKNVDSGRITTNDVRRRTDPRPKTTAKVTFKQRFRRVPTVLAAINMIDAAGNADLRIKLVISEVDLEGFRWTFESWGDSTLYAAGAHWIALGF